MKKLDRAFAVELPSRKTIAHNHKKPMNGIIAFLQPNQNSIVKTTMKQMSRIISMDNGDAGRSMIASVGGKIEVTLQTTRSGQYGDPILSSGYVANRIQEQQCAIW
jgi:hypothetical protein